MRSDFLPPLTPPDPLLEDLTNSTSSEAESSAPFLEVKGVAPPFEVVPPFKGVRPLGVGSDFFLPRIGNTIAAFLLAAADLEDAAVLDVAAVVDVPDVGHVVVVVQVVSEVMGIVVMATTDSLVNSISKESKLSTEFLEALLLANCSGQDNFVFCLLFSFSCWSVASILAFFLGFSSKLLFGVIKPPLRFNGIFTTGEDEAVGSKS